MVRPRRRISHVGIGTKDAGFELEIEVVMGSVILMAETFNRAVLYLKLRRLR
jgi:hypothetical protein